MAEQPKHFFSGSTNVNSTFIDRRSRCNVDAGVDKGEDMIAFSRDRSWRLKLIL